MSLKYEVDSGPTAAAGKYPACFEDAFGDIAKLYCIEDLYAIARLAKNISKMKKFNRKNVYTWGEIIYNPQTTFGPRIQDKFQLVLVHQGCADVRINDEWLQVNAGEVVLLMPGREELFRFSKDESTHHSWIHAEFEKDVAPWPELWDAQTEILPTGKRLRWIMDQLLHGALPSAGAGHQLAQALAEAAFYDVYMRANLLVVDKVPMHPAVERAKFFMANRLKESLGLKDVSRQAGLSPQHLSRLFREATGYSPIQHLWRMREDTGRRLLRETGLTIAEIADSCGFQNPFHFSRRMRLRYGDSPRALRRQDWGTA